MSLPIARGWQTLARRHSQLSFQDAVTGGILCRHYATPVLSSGTGRLRKPPIHGQPLAETHAHLIAPHDLTPGIPKAEYEERRTRLMENLPDGSLVVCLGGHIKYMSQGAYKFRQSSDIWYLTGFQEPDAALVLEKASTRYGRPYKMTMFCSGKNAHREKWDGASDVVSIFQADEARDTSHFYSHLKGLLPLYNHYYLSPSPTAHLRRKPRSRSLIDYIAPTTSGTSLGLQEAYDTLIDGLSSNRVKDLGREMARWRALKSVHEQAVLRKAADLSAYAHTKTMRFANLRSNLPEASLAAHFEYLCVLGGAERMAYVPVVASGANALIIHYTSNDNLCQDGDLVLIDAGCEYNGYASDITRTYPVFPSGRFTPAQAELYTAVLNTLKHCTSLCTESSKLSLYDLHAESCRVLTKELNRIGFNLRERSASAGHSEVEQVLYPHFLSHSVGIDLHESFMNRSSPIQSGMVITVEPGVYVPPSTSFPKHFHNIGIRIEDEVLVQKDHAVVLSVDAPKEIADVEGACQGSLGLGPY
ncbi:peptidase M24 [Gautieria morchelliformis]|nr:peptidase M24 [Gautieria morchelliformis]